MNAILPPREIVLASAGSGKTFRISSRLIGLLAAGAPPESVLASSFTRKAAGQILDRTLGRLARAALDPAEAEELSIHATLDPRFPAPADAASWSLHLERVVRSLHRLNVGTLDAFMVGAAGSFEAELGLPPGWRIADESEMARLDSRVLSGLLASVDRGEATRLIRLIARGAVARSVHDRLVGSMRDLLAIEDSLDESASDPWGAFRAAGPAFPSPREERERLAKSILTLPLPLTNAGGENRNWRNAIDRVAQALRDGDWEALVAGTLAQRVLAGDNVFAGAEIGSEVRRAVEECLEIARAGLRKVFADEVEALGTLAGHYATAYRRAQFEAGAFSFADITRLIGGGDPLGSRADLYYRLDGRTRHILLDEFQDTSIRQWEALEPLMDEVLSDDGRAAVVVADPKQSIYAWRGAEPALVHAVGDRYSLGDEHLAVSWRSSQVVLDFVNRVFGGIEGNPSLAKDAIAPSVAADWRTDFREHRAQNQGLPGFVSIEVGPEDDTRGSDRPLLYAHAARRIAELREAAPGFTIGVLTRTNRTVATLFLELRNLGIGVSQEGGNPLTDSAACETVLALLRLADHPGDTIAAYQVARSPLGEVVQLADHRKRDEVRRTARKIRAALLADGYGPTITSIARRIAPYCDRREARRLSQLAELAHRYDAAGTLRPGDFVQLVESTRIEDPASSDVRIMTVHQAKGLEFDLVVLPELGGTISLRDRSPVLPYRPDETSRATAVLPSGNKLLRALFPEIEAAHAQRVRALWRDSLSGLYVALTRARYAVHVVASAKSLSPPGVAITPASVVWAALSTEPVLGDCAAGEVVYAAGDQEWFRAEGATPEFIRPAEPTEFEAEPRIRVESAGRAMHRQTPSSLHASGRISVADLLRIGTAAAKERGILVHAWLERIRWVEEGIPDDEELRRIARTVTPHLRAETVNACIESYWEWVADGAVRESLSRSRYPFSEVEVERELPFVHRRGDLLVEGIIDRLVLCRENGAPVMAEILDFKTDQVTHETLSSRAFEYRAQIEAYAHAVSEMYGIPLDRCIGTLVFVEPGRLVTLLSSDPARALAPEPPAN